MKREVVICRLPYEIKKDCSSREPSIVSAARRSSVKQMSSYRSPNCKLSNATESKKTKTMPQRLQPKTKTVGAAVTFSVALRKNLDRIAVERGKVHLDLGHTIMTTPLALDVVLPRGSSFPAQTVYQYINRLAITHPLQRLAPLLQGRRALNRTPGPRAPTNLPPNQLPLPSSALLARMENDTPTPTIIRRHVALLNHLPAASRTIQIGCLARAPPLRQLAHSIRLNNTNTKPTLHHSLRCHRNMHNRCRDHAERSLRRNSYQDSTTYSLLTMTGWGHVTLNQICRGERCQRIGLT